MPISATDLLKKMLAKAGVVYDGDLTVDIPDEIATSLDNQLLTMDAALNNHPTVKKKYFAEAYNGIDAEIKGLITEFGLTDDIVRDIEAAGGSTKKMVTLARKVKELGEKQAPADSKKHADEIRLLNEKLAAEITKQTALKTDYDTKLKGIEIKTKLQGKLAGYKTVYDELDPVAKEAAINALLDKALQDSDAVWTFDERGNLSVVKKDNTNLFGDNHTLITPDSFIDKSLSKILKVTGAAPPNTPATPLPGGSQNSKNAALDQALAEAEQAYAASTKQVVTI